MLTLLIQFAVAFFALSPSSRFSMMFDVQKIQSQFFALLFASTLVPLAILSVYILNTSATVLSDLAVAELSNPIEQYANLVKSELDGAAESVLFLSQLPAIDELNDEGEVEADEALETRAQWRSHLTEIFRNQVEIANYMQLRYLDDSGREIVRVDSDGQNVRVIAEDRLQDKGDRGYFQETIALAPQSVYVSALDLNRERGQIERPLKPVIRYATPVFDAAGTRRGIVIANLFAQPILEPLQAAEEGAIVPMLVNSDGYYLYHPNAEKRWGFDLDRDERLANDYPPPVVSELLTEESGVVQVGNESIIRYERIYTDPDRQQFLVALSEVPQGVAFADLRNYQQAIAAIAIGSLVLVLVVGRWLLQQLLSRLRSLVKGIAGFSGDAIAQLQRQENIASQQSQSALEVADAVAEIEGAAERVARQAERMMQAARDAVAKADGGMGLMEKTLDGLQELQENVETIAAQSQRLGSQTSQVGNISNLAAVVEELAAQTNMLALNASIEAVRAGESGKGFAVVASEIRQLAERSRKTAEQIRATVPEVQTAISAMVQATRLGSQTLDAEWNIARQAGETFEQMRQTADEVFNGAREIADDTSTQADSLHQVARLATGVRQGAERTVEGLEETQEQVHQLNARSADLRRLV